MTQLQSTYCPPAHDEAQVDWCQVEETVRMLNLAVAHIEMSMCQGDESIDNLSQSFTSMVSSVTQICELSNEAPAAGADADISGLGEVVLQKIGAAIVAFQFYDRLTQQLDHVRTSLASLGDLVGSPERISTRSEWLSLQSQIRTGYSMDSEREMFDAVMQGESVEAVIAQWHDESSFSPDDIELF